MSSATVKKYKSQNKLKTFYTWYKKKLLHCYGDKIIHLTGPNSIESVLGDAESNIVYDRNVVFF